MIYVEKAGAEDRPLIHKIVDFPLVTMVLALAIAILCFTAGMLIAQSLLPSTPILDLQTKFDLVSVPLLLLAYKFVISRMGAHPHDDYEDKKALKHFGLGLAAGFLVFSIAVGIAAILGVYQIIGKGDFSDFLPALIGPALLTATSEELVFRGILFRWIEEFGGSWTALLITSAFFGAVHLLNPHASLIAAVGIAVAGLMLGAAYMLSRSLWLPMGIHAAWNFTQGEIWDIPVSGTKVHGLVVARLTGYPLLTGNGFGLEASLIAIIVATLFGFYLLRLAILRGELVKPSWVRTPS
ncbi:MAG TPA: CPBP family intramembrane glutamic endopeptidase [Sphingomicrobium sp.]|nr:CPBP family intramembrane glutamic endopeptidase [Sphingomicrobium sp.]